MTPRSEPRLNAAAIVEVLNRHGVQYVVIGAFAAIAQQAPIPATRDIDLTPDTTVDNLNRLLAALKELRAQIRTDAVEGSLPFDHDGNSLTGSAIWSLNCPFGEFDISFRPSSFEGGFRALVARSHKVMVDGIEVPIADLDVVIASKEAAGRPKDLRVLPVLYRHRSSRDTDGGSRSAKRGLAQFAVPTGFEQCRHLESEGRSVF
jgi:hypothetical protein